MYSFKGGTPLLAKARAIGKRVARFGWHVQLLIDLAGHPSFYEDWKDFPVPLVIDHMGHMAVSHGVGAPGFKGMLRLLAEGRCWVKLSGTYRSSALNENSAYRSVRRAACSVRKNIFAK
ncbi:MAG: amidohydrolase family protein [Pseudomonadota bacterium]